MQFSVLQANFAVTMVSVFPPLSGAMDTLVVVLMAVMREDNRILEELMHLE